MKTLHNEEQLLRTLDRIADSLEFLCDLIQQCTTTDPKGNKTLCIETCSASPEGQP